MGGEMMRFGGQPADCWYVADVGAAPPDSAVRESRFVVGWPGAWQRIEHGRTWISLDSEYIEQPATLDAPVFIVDVRWALTFHGPVPLLIADRISRREPFALGVEGVDRMSRAVFHAVGGGAPAIGFRAGAEQATTVEVWRPTPDAEPFLIEVVGTGADIDPLARAIEAETASEPR